MKKLISLIFLVTLFFGCSSSDDDDKKDVYTNADLVGTWTVQTITPKEVKTNKDKVTKAVKDKIDKYIDTNDEVFTFFADGKMNYSMGSFETTGTYQVKGNQLSYSMPDERGDMVSVTRTIKISGNTYSLDIDQTEYYQGQMKYMFPDENDIVVSKVIVTFTSKKK